MIVDFLPLENIDKAYVNTVLTVRDSQKSMVVTPKTFEKKSARREMRLKSVQLYGLKNVLVAADSTAFLSIDLKTMYFEKIEEFSGTYTIMYNTNTISFHSEKLAKVINAPQTYVDDEVLFLAGTFNSNYFHFLIELLSKIEFISQVPEHKRLKIAVPEYATENQNFKDLLSFFVPEHQTIALADSVFYHFKRIWHITYPNAVVPNIGEKDACQANFTKLSPTSISYLQTVCAQSFRAQSVKIEAVSRIFLARRSGFRKYNEVELLEIAARHCFSPVYLEDLNIHEQMFLMKNAEYIVGPSGAAWTNILFCTPNKTRGLMWLGNVWKDFSVFSTLADFCGLDLYNWRFDTDHSEFHGDYHLDPVEFEAQLSALLSLN